MSLKRDLAFLNASAPEPANVKTPLRIRHAERSTSNSDLGLDAINSDTDHGYESAPPLQAQHASLQESRLPSTPVHSPGQALRPIVKLSISDASGLTSPKSQYGGWKPPLQITPESVAISSLMFEWHRLQSEDSRAEPDGNIEFELSDFCIYAAERKTATTKNRKPNLWDRYVGGLEMMPLHATRASKGTYRFLFDGVLSCGDLSRYVQAVPFGPLSIGGYGIDTHSARDEVWIQSQFCARSKNKMFYRIRQPRSEYSRYHEGFLWIADLGKHFVDFLQDNTDNRRHVHFSHFQSEFHGWLTRHHGQSDQFQQWLRAFGRTDFRVAIAAHVEHLWTEAIDMNDKLRRHFIWKEIDPKALTAIPTQMSVSAPSDMTVVTPLVFETFKDIYFSSRLETRVAMDPVVKAVWRARKKALGFMTDEYSKPALNASKPALKAVPKSISPGDVVGIQPDTEDTHDTSWGRTTSDTWFAFVRAVHEDRMGKFLAVTWLYRPEDTTLSNMTYPFKNELFMSDHCNCGEQTFRAEEVTCTISVNWYPHQIPASDIYFVRQKYCTKEHAFVTITPNDFVCACEEKTDVYDQATKIYKIQDTILAESAPGHKRLDPFVIVDFVQGSRQIQVRQLLRAQEEESVAVESPAANELIWTDRLMLISPKTIKRKCHIRSAPPGGQVPELYRRGGQADVFIITHRLVLGKEEDTVQALETPYPGPMIEGSDFSIKLDRSPMNLLSLFSGGGNFDRGLEEGGCVCTKWAVEWNSLAAHTYRANCKDPEDTQIFLGSVDELLARAIDGKTSKLIPQIGEVDCICGGSPCQGFSMMQADTQSTQSLTNASKVASVAAYIDHYRPSYALLENVVSMTRPLGPQKANVFSQLLCALVAMGYQVQQFNLDAWSFGDPQSRSRLFVSITAPGLVPMPHPHPTHSHPPGKGKRKLGKAVNGQSFGERSFETAPFKFVTAKEATKDLPDLGDGHVLVCIPYPDHRQHTRQRALLRSIMKLIPTNPPGMSLVRTIKSNRYVVAKPIMDYYERQSELRRLDASNSMCRVDGDGLFPTVVTKLAPEDGKVGRGLHWTQPRTQTLMEARRAQGFLDHEPLIGWVSAQWKIVGNSVARSVSLALGISLRNAWLQNPEHLIRRVTNTQFTGLLSREVDIKETDTTSGPPLETTKRQPVILITAPPSFDSAEYETYDDCEVESEEWTDAALSASAGEPSLATPQNPGYEWSEVDDIIADVLGSLPVDDEDGAIAAEAQAQEEVAIEPMDTLEVFYDVQEYVEDDWRPSKVARRK
ncbi:S-adenosyl-L-methionine-dependent methyltransferase [Venturia nashicola]|uniref:DNA (cytosine-5-)-methyltransferase n=1 Tax=Venturia nashicola TaxID=86259 RepID=A0A4Z1PPR6_9PEZI|nr:S-adenosyl-L-methionine-dependent methyltransferase [Venturia nashicola]